CQPRSGDVKGWLDFARNEGILSPVVEQTIRDFLSTHDKFVRGDLERLDDEMNQLRTRPGVDVFPLSEAAFSRIPDLRPASLKPYDEAIMAAVLARASEMRGPDPHARLIFCTL